jgi:hypothetical protein
MLFQPTAARARSLFFDVIPCSVRGGDVHSVGSGQVETANDLIGAKRQKGVGMHWSLGDQ